MWNNGNFFMFREYFPCRQVHWSENFKNIFLVYLLCGKNFYMDFFLPTFRDFSKKSYFYSWIRKITSTASVHGTSGFQRTSNLFSLDLSSKKHMCSYFQVLDSQFNQKLRLTSSIRSLFSLTNYSYGFFNMNFLLSRKKIRSNTKFRAFPFKKLWSSFWISRLLDSWGFERYFWNSASHR